MSTVGLQRTYKYTPFARRGKGAGRSAERSFGKAKRIVLVDHLVGEATAFEEIEAWFAGYASVNSAGCRPAKQMLLDCFDLSWGAFFHKYLVLREKATVAPDFAEAMDAYRPGRDPHWR